MKTTWKIKNIKKTTKDDEYTEITFNKKKQNLVGKLPSIQQRSSEFLYLLRHINIGTNYHVCR